MRQGGETVRPGQHPQPHRARARPPSRSRSAARPRPPTGVPQGAALPGRKFVRSAPAPPPPPRIRPKRESTGRSRSPDLSEARGRRRGRHEFVRSARAPARAGHRVCPKRVPAPPPPRICPKHRPRPRRGTGFVRSERAPAAAGCGFVRSAPTPAMAGRVFRTKRAPTPVRDRGNGATGAHAPRSVPPPGTRAFVRAFPAGRFGPTLPADRAPAVRRPAPAPRSRP